MPDEMKVELDECRDAFEFWYSDGGKSPRAVARIGGQYELMQAQASWIAWDAAWWAARSNQQQQLAAAREELAITRASLEARNEQLAGCESALGAAWEDAAKAREAEADAARYRAMRHAGWGKGASRDLWFDILRAETPDQLDAAINATLQRDRQP